MPGLVANVLVSAGKEVTPGEKLLTLEAMKMETTVYAERAVLSVGAVRGSVLAVWRILRCSPLSAGGVDLPPTSFLTYDVITHLPGAIL